MRIGIFAASLGGGASLTGVNTYSLALVESLYMYDIENEYILILSETNKTFYEHIKENKRWRKIFIESVLVEDFSILKKIYRILPMYLPLSEKMSFNYKKTGFVSIPSEVIDSVDLIHFTVFNSCSSIPFFINKPYVVTLHDLRLFYPNFSKKMTDKFYFTHITMKRIFKKIAIKSKKIITEVQFVKEDIKKFLNIPENKIEVLVSPLPDIYMQRLNITTSKNIKIKEKYSLPDKYLFYPSVFTKDKNHEKLVLAIKLLQKKGIDISLVLSGPDSENLMKIKKLIENLNLHNTIKYIGFIPKEDLVEIYRLSHGVVVPTLFESVSLPVWEAMIMGKPVAASYLCGIPYQLGDLGIYFDPMDINSIAEGVKKLWYLEGDEYNSISMKLKEKALKMLDKKRYADALVKVYKEVLT